MLDNAVELEEIDLISFLLASADSTAHISELLSEVHSAVYDHGAEIGQGVRDEFRCMFIPSYN